MQTDVLQVELLESRMTERAGGHGSSLHAEVPRRQHPVQRGAPDLLGVLGPVPRLSDW